IPLDLKSKSIFNKILCYFFLYIKNRKQVTLEVLFNKITKTSNIFSNNSIITPINLHRDFEKSLSNNTKKKFFPRINIKILCLKL
ncbi:hypothetical protein H8356DRAFT_945592, partial [Neocallimastix lanati (nom. inval.)]